MNQVHQCYIVNVFYIENIFYTVIQNINRLKRIDIVRYFLSETGTQVSKKTTYDTTIISFHWLKWYPLIHML